MTTIISLLREVDLEKSPDAIETMLRAASLEVTIGLNHPTVIIGEHINPTGRKVFTTKLRASDLSRIARDAADQGAAGAPGQRAQGHQRDERLFERGRRHRLPRFAIPHLK